MLILHSSMKYIVFYVLIIVISCESVDVFRFLAKIISKVRSARVSFHEDQIPTQATNLSYVIDSLQNENARLAELNLSLRTKLNQYKLLNSDLKRNQDQSNSMLSQQMAELRKVYERDMAEYQSSMASKIQQEAESSILAVRRKMEIDHLSQTTKMQQDYDAKVSSLNETIKRLKEEKSSLTGELESLKSRVGTLSSQLDESKSVSSHRIAKYSILKFAFIFI
jgi:chromosome segregation ATPase